MFGCHLWKAGGLFDGLDVQCTEQTNFDDYSMMMFDPAAPRPDVCQQADPDNVVCQLEGKYTLHLNKVCSFTTNPLRLCVGLISLALTTSCCSVLISLVTDVCDCHLLTSYPLFVLFVFFLFAVRHKKAIQPHGREVSRHGTGVPSAR